MTKWYGEASRLEGEIFCLKSIFSTEEGIYHCARMWSAMFCKNASGKDLGLFCPGSQGKGKSEEKGKGKGWQNGSAMGLNEVLLTWLESGESQQVYFLTIRLFLRLLWGVNMCPKSIQTSIGGGFIKPQSWKKLPFALTGKSKGGSKGSKGTKGSKGKASIAGKGCGRFLLK